MRVIIAGGGTGGHIYPGVAVAKEFQRRDPSTEVVFVGTVHGLEVKIIPREGFRLEFIEIAGLKNVSFMSRLKTLLMLPGSFLQARSLIRRIEPDIVIGVGGYSSGPVLLVAAWMGLPTLIIEPNALPGFTNRRLARFIDRAAVTFEVTRPYFAGKAVVTGNPVRQEFQQLPKKERTDCFHLLIFGGSQGAHAINVAMVEALSALSSQKARLSITHQTGEKDLEMVKQGYEKMGWEADVRPFLHEMAREFERADVVISRAGATTVAELTAAGKAAILVPFPFAADDHQRKNAEALAEAGAAKMILQQDLTGERLAREIKSLLTEPARIDEMERASRSLARADAAQRTVDLALEVLKEKRI